MGEKEKTGFSIKLKGEMDGVDADTFLDMLGNFSVAIHQINESIQPNKSLKITIHAIEPGSYDIILSLTESFIELITQHITREHIKTAAEIVAILSGLFIIRKHLKGEKPKTVERDERRTVIVNGDGNKISVDNRAYDIHIDNQVVDGAIARGFETLDADESIKGMEIYDDKKERLFNAPRDDFKIMAKPSPSTEKDTKIKSEEAILIVFKVVFETGYKWQFYYQGIKIFAAIKDDSFYDRINRGKKFAKGDTLIADIEITQAYDKTIQAYINKEYAVVKIKQHIPRGEQKKLFEFDDLKNRLEQAEKNLPRHPDEE